MTDLRMLRHNEILQNSTRSYNTVLEVFYTETFQVLHFKVLQQFFSGSCLCKYPVFQLKCEELTSEIPLEHATFTTLEKYFFRRKVIQQLIYIVKRTFRRKKFTCRYIQKSDTTCTFTQMDGCQEIVFTVIQYIVIDRYPRSHQFRNTSFHQLLRQFRIFQLVTYSHTLSCTYQFG